MRILVDTNVFLDLLLKREPFFNDGVIFINKCKSHRHLIYINVMSFRDIEYVLKKKVTNKSLRDSMLNKIYTLVDKIAPLTADNVIDAIFEPGVDFEDTLISNSAETTMLDCIVTSNSKDFTNSKIPVFSLKKFNSIDN